MTVEHHDLQHDFPEFHDRIHALKTSNAHFARLFDEYHEVDRQVRRIEQEIETPSDAVTEELKMRRVKLKGELYAMLRA
ncbi:YdcH family protein [Sulfurivermis fontis]|uniref:YdcH family protein n=1 Tax=Sulfurivermis fontis TaxID=1972068 RepID=UPI000FDABF66|nr:YdcH family protein [Sulfurivermis fontis]